MTDPTQNAPATDPFGEANVERLRKLASDVLRKRGKPTDPSTMSIVDGVLMNFLRAQHGGVLPTFSDEVELTRYLSRAIRNHLVSLARKRQAARRPQDAAREEWQESVMFPATQNSPSLVLDVHGSLEELSGVDAKAAQVVEMIFFGGCTQPEVAAALGCTIDQVRGDWEYAKAWLRRKLAARQSP